MKLRQIAYLVLTGLVMGFSGIAKADICCNNVSFPDGYCCCPDVGAYYCVTATCCNGQIISRVGNCCSASDIATWTNTYNTCMTTAQTTEDTNNANAKTVYDQATDDNTNSTNAEIAANCDGLDIVLKLACEGAWWAAEDTVQGEINATYAGIQLGISLKYESDASDCAQAESSHNCVNFP